MDVKATLNSKTVAELRQLAAQRHIARRSTMKKAELVDALSASDVELTLAIEQITPEQQAAYAAEYNAAKAKRDVVADSVSAMIEQDAPERIRFDADPAADDEVDALLDAVLGEYTGPRTGEVAILRDAPGTAIVTAAFDGFTQGGSIVRKGKRLVLRSGNVTITGNTFEKVAKLFAQRLGFRAERIDVAKSF